MFYRELIKAAAGPGTCSFCVVIDGENAGSRAIYLDGREYLREEGFPADAAPEAGVYPAPVIGMTSGGRVFRETIGRRKKAVVCGGGHVALEVVKLLKNLGFEITVLEDRPLYAGKAKEAGADDVLVGPFDELLDSLPDEQNMYYIIMTREHTYDLECLDRIMARGFAYAGMMGSRGRIASAKELMLRRGAAPAALDRLHAPIGLSIGAETPGEIAVSVAAEIIRVSRESRISELPGDIERELLAGGSKVLALIVGRQGSAPREPGARMVVREDGSFAGTIGGGIFEARIIEAAREMMKSDLRTKVCSIDLTGKDPAAGGMVCGGVLEVFLERIGDT